MKSSVKILLFFCIIIIGCSRGSTDLVTAKRLIEDGLYYDAISVLVKVKDIENVDYSIKKSALNLISTIIDTIRTSKYEEMKQNREDNAYLDFKFGMSKSATNKYLDKLMRKNKISNRVTYSFQYLGEKIKYSGYELDFFIINANESYKCKALLNCSFFNKKLDNIGLFLFDFPKMENSSFTKEIVAKYDLSNMYSQKYGNNSIKEIYYSEDDSDDIEYFWQESNKGILIRDTPLGIFIEYQDLISKIEKDDIQKVIEDLKKENEKEKANQSIQDI